MPVKFNVVTWYSRLLSYFFIFGIFPVIVFQIGVRYNQTVETLSFSYVAPTEAYVSGAYDAKSFQSTGVHAARSTIAGTWVSNEDPEYQLVIKPDNMFYEKRYGTISRSGSWTVKDTMTGTDYAHLPTGLYLQNHALNTEGQEQTLYYKILMLNSTILDISNLGTNNTTTFTRKPDAK